MSDFLQFLFTKTIIKYLPKLQKRLKKLKRDADKLELSEKQKIIYIIYHFDYPHLSIQSLTYKPSSNNFSIYCRIQNFATKITGLKFYLNCKGKYNNMEIIKIDGKSPLHFINNKIKLYDNPGFRNNKLFSNLIINTFKITYYYDIHKLTLKNNININVHTLGKNKTRYGKYRQYIFKKINKNTLYVKIGAFMIRNNNKNEYFLLNRLKVIKQFRNKKIIIDIRGNGGGSQEVAYPFIKAIFGKEVETLIREKKQLQAIHMINNKKIINICEKNKVNRNVRNKFTGRIIILMNYTSGSMSIIFIAWLLFLEKTFNIDLTIVGTDTYYQRGLANSNILKKYNKYNLQINGPRRFISKRGFRDINIIYKPDFYYMNETHICDNQYPERNVPLNFILKLTKKNS